MSLLFPELDDAPLTTPAASVTTPTPTPALRPPRRVEDLPAATVFERLLGFARDARPALACEVTSVATDGPDRVQVDVEGPMIPASRVWITRGVEARAFAATAEWSIAYQGQTLHPTLAALLRRAASRMAKVPYAVLHDIAQTATPPAAGGSNQDKGRGEGGPDEAQGEHGFQMLHSIVFTYGGETGWLDFFEGHEQYRGYCQRTRGNVVSVHHTELECRFGEAPRDERFLSFFNHARADEPGGGDGGETQLFTDLDETDVIKGGTPKLDRLLDSVTRLKRAPELVVLNSACTTIVTGDDIEGSADKLRKKVRVPVINAALTPDPRKEIIRFAHERGDLLRAPRREGYVNIVGLPKVPGHRELFSVLEECGIRVNCWLLPDLDLSSFQSYGAAELQVLYDWAWNDDAYAMLTEGVTLPTIRPPSPFGVAGTRAWLGSIASALGREAELERVWERRYGELLRGWEAEARRARGYRLGFVGDEAALPRFLAPSRLLGAPLVAMVKELGFGVDFLKRRPPGAPRPEGAVTSDDGAERSYYFSSPGELEALFNGLETVAYYSEMYFDRRLTRTGRNSFSMKDVSMGVPGAAATRERLLTVCGTPFYRIFGGYLGRPFAVGCEEEGR